MKRETTIKVRVTSSMKQEGGVGVLDVEPIGDVEVGSEAQYSPRGLPIVVGAGRGAKVLLEPGAYVASVRLPAGKVFRAAFRVDADDGQVVVLGAAPKKRSYSRAVKAAAAGSGHEFAVPQFSVRNTAPMDIVARTQVSPFELAQAFSSAATEAPYPRSPTSDPAVLMHFLAAVNPTEVQSVLEDPRVDALSKRGRSLLPRRWTQPEVLKVLGIPRKAGEITPISSSRRRLAVGVDYSDNEPGVSLHYALLYEEGVSPVRLLARLPGLWRTVRTQEVAKVKVEATRLSSSNLKGATYQMSVTVSDPDIQSVLGFIRQGDLEGALAVLDQCGDLLQHKSENPYAAAAAGYVMLNAPQGRLEIPWESWIGNLGHRFNDLPDGMIQHATLLLQGSPGSQRTSQSDYFPSDPSRRRELASSLLKKSILRGLPIYRAGLRLLASNLRIVLNEPAEDQARQQFEMIYELVNWLLMRVDPAQVFTVVDISDLYGG